MSLDSSKLKNVKMKTAKEYTAQCPVCFEAGSDSKGEHLWFHVDGPYACIADKAHSKKIFELAGRTDRPKVARPLRMRIPVIPEKMTLEVLGRYGRVEAHTQPQEEAAEVIEKINSTN
jgi:hypothetical protein